MNLAGEDRLVSTAKVEREEEALVEASGGDGGDVETDLAETLEPELLLEATPEDDLDLEGEEGESFEDEDEGGPPDETVH